MIIYQFSPKFILIWINLCMTFITGSTIFIQICNFFFLVKNNESCLFEINCNIYMYIYAFSLYQIIPKVIKVNNDIVLIIVF